VQGSAAASCEVEARCIRAQAKIRPHQPAFVTAAGGDTVTYAGLELCSNRLADFLRASGHDCRRHLSPPLGA